MVDRADRRLDGRRGPGSPFGDDDGDDDGGVVAWWREGMTMGGGRREVLAANIVTFAAGEKALRALSARGVRAGLLKGAWLVERGLRSMGERPFADVDLLIDLERRWEAHQAMLGAGFVRQHERPTRPYTDRMQIEFSYRLPSGGPMVELHFALAPRGWLRVTTRELLDAAHPGKFGEAEALHPADDDAVCVVIYHLGHHGFAVSREMLEDVAALRRAGLLDDVGGVLERCRRWGCLTIGWVGLELFNAAFPGQAVALPSGYRPPRWKLAYLDRVIRRGEFPPARISPTSFYGRFVFRALLMDDAAQATSLVTDPAERVVRDVVEVVAGKVRGGWSPVAWGRRK